MMTMSSREREREIEREREREKERERELCSEIKYLKCQHIILPSITAAVATSSYSSIEELPL
jgi:hypothetical protein